MPLPRSLGSFAPLLATLLIVTAYANHFGNSFHFDDIHTIVDNPAVRSLHNVPRFFSDASTFSVLPANRTWRPIVSLTLALDYWVAGGYRTLPFHVSSFVCFLLQLGFMGMLFESTLATFSPATSARNRLLAIFAATWYGLHPALAETVNYIIQRGDILSTLGLVAALVLYLRRPGWRAAGLYLVPLAFGLLSKPPALIFPALLLAWLLLFTLPADHSPPKLLGAILPSLIVTAGIMALEANLTPRSYLPTTVPAGRYLLTQPYVALRYFATFFLPVHLNVDTDLQPLGSVNAAAVAGFLFLAVLLTAIVLTARRRTLRPISFGLIWFLLGLLPTSLYPLAEVENDHRMVLPFVGLVFAATCSLAALYERLRPAAPGSLPRTAAAAAVLLFATNAYGTHRRNQVWRTEETLWADDVAKSPNNGRGLMIYGLTQMQKGNLPRALSLFEQAHRYTPNYATLEINLGVVHAALHAPGVAEQHFLRAVALAPTDDLPHLYYGRFLLDAGRLPEATSQLRTAVLLNPAREEPHILLARAAAASPEAWLNRSLAQYQQHDYSGCITSARQALALRPDYAEAENNIGAAEAALGHWDLAIAADTAALRLRPVFPLARNNLAWAIQQQRLQLATSAGR